MTEIAGDTAAENSFKLFPLIRLVSLPVVRILAILPVTPNQITAVSLVVGLWGAWMFRLDGMANVLTASALFFGCYVLDNCDGEIARLKNLSSEFGKRFDTFVDWIVHAAFFLGLGWGEAVRTENDFWMWCGALAAFGGTVNYFIDSIRDSREKAAGMSKVEDGPDETTGDRTIYTSRVIRSDFCFIVLALALIDSVWILLPASAVGAQIYWGLQFLKGFRRHHV